MFLAALGLFGANPIHREDPEALLQGCINVRPQPSISLLVTTISRAKHQPKQPRAYIRDWLGAGASISLSALGNPLVFALKSSTMLDAYLLLFFLSLVGASRGIAMTAYNPPALPLSVKSPYLNTWLEWGDQPQEIQTGYPQFWTVDVGSYSCSYVTLVNDLLPSVADRLGSGYPCRYRHIHVDGTGRRTSIYAKPAGSSKH